MELYTCCYDMCTQRQPYNWSDELYANHGVTIHEYLQASVLPAIANKEGIFLLKELRHRWSNHTIMNKWMRMFFIYLDRYHVKHHSLYSLSDVGLMKFKSIVFDEVKVSVTKVILEMINTERTGVLVDRIVLKDIVGVYETMGLGSNDTYTTDFEEQVSERSAAQLRAAQLSAAQRGGG